MIIIISLIIIHLYSAIKSEDALHWSAILKVRYSNGPKESRLVGIRVSWVRV